MTTSVVPGRAVNAALEELEGAVVTRVPDMPLHYFARDAWHVVEPGVPYKETWHQRAICDFLTAMAMGEIRSGVINIPPGFGKSLWACVFFFTWVWTWWPGSRWMFFSYVDTLSTRDSLKCRDILASPWYQRHWGNTFQLRTDQNTKTRFANTRTGYRYSFGVNSGGLGERASFLICDDPHNTKQAESDDVRQSVLDWWDKTVTTRGTSWADFRKLIIMQRLHDRDLSGHVLAEALGYAHLMIPMEFESKRRCVVPQIRTNDPRTEEGELAWPEQFPREAVEDMKKPLGSYGAAGQFQQNPVPAGGAIIRPEWFKRYRKHELPELFDEMILSCDFNFKDGRDSDYTVIQAWARHGAMCYLLDEWREKCEFLRALAGTLEMTAKWPKAKAKLIEDKANGPAIISTLRRKVPGLIPIEPHGDKVARARGVAPYVEAGNVSVPDPEWQPWVSAYLLEIERFPRGAYDDRMDATTQALDRLERGASHQAGMRRFEIVTELTEAAQATNIRF